MKGVNITTCSSTSVWIKRFLFSLAALLSTTRQVSD
jgi:hypothetical protein